MKQALSFLLTLAMLCTLAACGSGSETEQTPLNSGQAASDTAEAAQEAGQEGKVLVAYFSWADNAALTDDVDAVTSPSVVSPGNVQQLAGWVQQVTGGELFAIQVTDPYPSDWDACLERANEERGADARPALTAHVDNIDQYSTVFLGYPNWWYGVPMPLLSFLEQNDLSGKQVYLFCSHGTGGLANSVEQIRAAAPDAAISDDIFDCFEEEAAGSQQAVQDWVRSLGFGASENAEDSARQIAVHVGDDTIVCALNDSSAADSLYAQLPLTVAVEDYSDNEKIFYPPSALDTADTPPAQGGAGTLAYYAPWGDVVFFYGDYSENPSLYALGQVVSGAERIEAMSGTITIEAVA